MSDPIQNSRSPDVEDTLEDTRLFWLGIGEDFVRRTPRRIEGAAKQMIAVAGILVGLYFNAVALGGIKTPLPKYETLLFLSPIICLLGSLISSLLIFLPNRYKMEMRSPAAAELIYRRAVKTNYRLLGIASSTLAIGIFLIILVLWRFLG